MSRAKEWDILSKTKEIEAPITTIEGIVSIVIP
jgi:hypothetical protein